jgi:GT2 family glycosyltransferase
MSKISQPRLTPFYPEAQGQQIGICIPVYEHIGNEGLAQLIWTANQGSDLPFMISMGVGKQPVAKNRNKALKRLPDSIEWVLMVDDDVLLPPGYASLLMKPMLEDKTIGAVSAVMSGARGEAQNDCHPGATGDKEIKDIVNLPGTCFMYNRERVGDAAFDENYQGSQWEDTDFMRQITTQGLRTVITSRVSIIHKNNWSQNKYWEENKEYFYSKWPRMEG